MNFLRSLFRRRKNYGTLTFDVETCTGRGPDVLIVPKDTSPAEVAARFGFNSFEATEARNRGWPCDERGNIKFDGLRAGLFTAGTQHNPQMSAYAWASAGAQYTERHRRIMAKEGNPPPYTEEELKAAPGYRLFEGNFDEIERRVRRDYCKNDAADALALLVEITKQRVADESRRHRLIRDGFVLALILLCLSALFLWPYG